MATVSRDSSRSDLVVPEIVAEKISAVVRRSRGLRLLAAGIFALAAALFVLLVAIGIDGMLVLFETAQRVRLTTSATILMGVLALASLAVALFRRVTRLDAARRIDEQVPQLQERWTSLSEFSATTAPPALRGSKAMRRKVAEEAAELERVVEPKQIRTGRDLALAGGCLAAIVGLWIVVFAIDPAQVAVLIRRFVSPAATISLTEIRSETGDLIQPRGSNLKLEASVTGRTRPSAMLSIRTAEGVVETHALELLKGETPRFVFPLKKLEQSFDYRFRSGDGETAWHTVTVADRPTLKSVDFRIIPPAYSKLPETHRTGLPKSVKALQGSRLVVQFETSIPLRSFVLQGDNKVEQRLTEGEANRYQYEADLDESFAFRPVMESVDGLANDRPPRCEIIVYNDQAPVVTIASPTTDVAVRPEDSVTIAFDAKDDLGVSRAELVIYDSSKPDGEELKTIPIPLGDQEGARTVHAQTELDLKEFDLKHGAELTYAVRVYDTKDKLGTLRPTDSPDAATARNSQPQNSKPQNSSAKNSTANPREDSELANAQNPQDQNAEGKSGEPKDAPQNDENAQSQDGKQSNGKPSDGKSSQSSPSAQSSADAKDAAGDQSSSDSPDDQKQSPDNNETGKPRDGANPNNPEEANEDDEQKDQKNAGGGNTWTPKSAAKDGKNSKKPGGGIEGKRRPDFHMAKNELDTPAGQCSSCSRKRITIDEWAGSYASQVLEKLQLQIDPVLKELREALTQAKASLQPVAERTRTGKSWETNDSVGVRKGDEFLATADQHVKDLTAKSDGTPYAFIGLQLKDIAQLHILPARHHLSDVTLFDAPSNTEDLTASIVHIQRALELLEQLTRQYEAVKLNQQLADTMLRIKKMHQIFLEGTFAMLKSQKPTLNPKERAFMELDLSDEYLKKLQELLEKKLAIQAELAKVLANDPRLLERFMARSRLEATTLRDQLTLLNRNQQDLMQDLKDGFPADKEGAKLELKNRVPHRIAEATRISQEAAKMLDNYIVWTPRNLNVDEGILATFKTKLIRLVATATEFAAHAGEESSAASLDAAETFYQQLREFKDNLPDVLDEVSHPKLPTHLANRAQEAEKLVTDVTGWIRKEKMMDAGHHQLAAEVDQHRITVDTMELTRKLTSLKAQCQGISPELAQAAETFLATMETDLVPELESAQLTLGSNSIPESIEHQTKAVEHFTKAEHELDVVMDGIIKHIDSLPYEKSPQWKDGTEPQSLEELLAMLEDEARAAEALGIPCCRPSNLLIEKDWSMPGGSSSGGSGSGGSNGGSSGGARRSWQAQAQMNQARQANAMAERLRRQTEETIRKLRGGSDSASAPRTAKKNERKWDTLGSKLEDHLRQGRGNLPPEQYRRAIELYFELLAGESQPAVEQP